MAASKECQDITYRATAGSPPYRTGWEQSDGTGRAATSECSVAGGSLSCNLANRFFVLQLGQSVYMLSTKVINSQTSSIILLT